MNFAKMKSCEPSRSQVGLNLQALVLSLRFLDRSSLPRQKQTFLGLGDEKNCTRADHIRTESEDRMQRPIATCGFHQAQ